MEGQLTKKVLLASAIVLLLAIIVGVSWLTGITHLAESDQTFGVMMMLSFASGVSMIIVPCTLPLLFLIIPLATGKDYKRGMIMALLFGLGITITITGYGIAMALLGKVIGIEAAAPWLLTVAGVLAYLFALSEFSILTISFPFLRGDVPDVVQRQRDYIKSFGLGIVLGNVGVGCPNPLFYVLLFYIAGTANVLEGTLLGFIHGVGRAAPLIFLTILSLFSIDFTQKIVTYREGARYISAWLLAVMAAILISSGLFNLHGWWFIYSPMQHPYAIIVTTILLVIPFLVQRYQHR